LQFSSLQVSTCTCLHGSCCAAGVQQFTLCHQLVCMSVCTLQHCICSKCKLVMKLWRHLKQQQLVIMFFAGFFDAYCSSNDLLTSQDAREGSKVCTQGSMRLIHILQGVGNSFVWRASAERMTVCRVHKSNTHRTSNPTHDAGCWRLFCLEGSAKRMAIFIRLTHIGLKPYT